MYLSPKLLQLLLPFLYSSSSGLVEQCGYGDLRNNIKKKQGYQNQESKNSKQYHNSNHDLGEKSFERASNFCVYSRKVRSMRPDRSERTLGDCEVVIRVINDEISNTHDQQVNQLPDSINR